MCLKSSFGDQLTLLWRWKRWKAWNASWERKDRKNIGFLYVYYAKIKRAFFMGAAEGLSSAIDALIEKRKTMISGYYSVLPVQNCSRILGFLIIWQWLLQRRTSRERMKKGNLFIFLMKLIISFFDIAYFRMVLFFQEFLKKSA